MDGQEPDPARRTRASAAGSVVPAGPAVPAPPAGRRRSPIRRPPGGTAAAAGLRTPLLPTDVPASRTRAQRFDQAVLEAVADLEERWPGRLDAIEFAVDEVPVIPADGPGAAVGRGGAGRRGAADQVHAARDRRPRAGRPRPGSSSTGARWRSGPATPATWAIWSPRCSGEQVSAVLGEAGDGGPGRRRRSRLSAQLTVCSAGTGRSAGRSACPAAPARSGSA